jgi:hypothetical protein
MKAQAQPTWAGKPIVHPDDVHDLDSRAAIHEMQNKMPRDQAEARAHEDYRREHHVKGAAFHLSAMKAAHAAGQSEDAKKHGAVYALHMGKLGYDPHSEPPAEVRGAADGDHKEAVLRFKAHKSDQFLLDGAKESSMNKAEPPTVAPPPAAARPTPQLHHTVEGFMGGLKALPKGSPERGKYMTAHMSHGPFLAALKQHPQGQQIHSMLTQHLNSAANAGFKPGGTVATAKSEHSEALHWIYRAAKILLKNSGE